MYDPSMGRKSKWSLQGRLLDNVTTRVSQLGNLYVNYANGSKSPQSLFVDFLVAFQGCCRGFDGESKFPIAGWFANNGGETIDADGGGNVLPRLGWEGTKGGIGGGTGVGVIVGSAIL